MACLGRWVQGLRADQQADLAALIDEREHGDAGICRAAQPFAGAGVKPAAVAGTGEHGPLNRAAGQHGSCVRAAVSDRVQLAGRVVNGHGALRKMRQNLGWAAGYN